MATKPDTDMHARWESMFSHHNAVAESLNEAQGKALAAKYDQLGAIQSYLITMPAPHISAVIEKLTLLFDCQMEGNDEEAVAKRTILADLRRLREGCPDVAGPAPQLIGH